MSRATVTSPISRRERIRETVSGRKAPPGETRYTVSPAAASARGTRLQSGLAKPQLMRNSPTTSTNARAEAPVGNADRLARAMLCISSNPSGMKRTSGGKRVLLPSMIVQVATSSPVVPAGSGTMPCAMPGVPAAVVDDELQISTPSSSSVMERPEASNSSSPSGNPSGRVPMNRKVPSSSVVSMMTVASNGSSLPSLPMCTDPVQSMYTMEPFSTVNRCKNHTVSPHTSRNRAGSSHRMDRRIGCG